jgi:glutathione S-transferase
MDDRITLFGSFTFKTGAQRTFEYRSLNRDRQVPTLRHHGLTLVQLDVILDYLARVTGYFRANADGTAEKDGVRRGLAACASW